VTIGSGDELTAAGIAAPLRLGVGICTLNEEDALPRLLARLSDAEDVRDRADLVIIADGGSTDGTVALARERGALVLETGRGRGLQLCAAANRMLDEGADVLLFLHADSLPRLGALTSIRNALTPAAEQAREQARERSSSRSSEQDLEGSCDAVAMRQVIDAREPVYRLIERAANARARRGMVYGDSGLAVRAEAYRAVGGFRPLPLFEDVDLSKRLRKRTRIEVLDDAVLLISARRWQAEGVLRCTSRNWILRGLFECGVPTAVLERLYRPLSGRRAH
jgi:glycosyltransferase involved in cell wall biosynthesis